MYFRNCGLRKTFKKPRFKTPFDSEHAKGAQTLLKSARKCLYHFFHQPVGNFVAKFLGYSYVKS